MAVAGLENVLKGHGKVVAIGGGGLVVAIGFFAYLKRKHAGTTTTTSGNGLAPGYNLVDTGTSGEVITISGGGSGSGTASAGTTSTGTTGTPPTTAPVTTPGVPVHGPVARPIFGKQNLPGYGANLGALAAKNPGLLVGVTSKPSVTDPYPATYNGVPINVGR